MMFYQIHRFLINLSILLAFDLKEIHRYVYEKIAIPNCYIPAVYKQTRERRTILRPRAHWKALRDERCSVCILNRER